MLAGDLAEFPLPDVLRLLAASGKSGVLTVDAAPSRARIELQAGRVSAASPDVTTADLARRLLPTQALHADRLVSSAASGGRLRTDAEMAGVLLSQGLADPALLAPVLHQQRLEVLAGLLRRPLGTFQFRPAPAPSALPDQVLGDVEGLLVAADVLATALRALDAAERGTGSDGLPVRDRLPQELPAPVRASEPAPEPAPQLGPDPDQADTPVPEPVGVALLRDDHQPDPDTLRRLIAGIEALP